MQRLINWAIKPIVEAVYATLFVLWGIIAKRARCFVVPSLHSMLRGLFFVTISGAFCNVLAQSNTLSKPSVVAAQHAAATFDTVKKDAPHEGIFHRFSALVFSSSYKTPNNVVTNIPALPSQSMLHKIQKASMQPLSDVRGRHQPTAGVKKMAVSRPATIDMLRSIEKKQADLELIRASPYNNVSGKSVAPRAPTPADDTAVRAKLIKVHYQSAEVLQRVIVSTLLKSDKKSKLVLDKRSNSLLLLMHKQPMQLLEKFIRCIDQPQPQVKIVTRILDVDQQALSDLGVDLLMHQNAPTVNSGGYSMSLPPATASSGSFQLPVLQLPASSQIDIKVNALQQSGNVKLIATPQLLTLNRHTATIQSGEDVPYQQATSSGATSIAFKRAGLSLQVTPTILPRQRVRINIVLNNDQVSTAMSNGVPLIRTRQLKTWVTIQQGHTVVLGGIFRTTESDQKSGITWLSRIPIFGLLFRHRVHSAGRQQLLIFMTPHIVGSTPVGCQQPLE